MKKELKEAKRREAIRKAHPFRLTVISWTLIEQWYYGLVGRMTPDGFKYPEFNYSDDPATSMQVFNYIQRMEDACKETIIAYGRKPGEPIKSTEERQCNWVVKYLNDNINTMYPNMSYRDKLIVLSNTVALGFWDHWCVTKEPNPAWQKLNQALYDFSWFLVPDDNHYLANFVHEHYMKCTKAMAYDFS